MQRIPEFRRKCLDLRDLVVVDVDCSRVQNCGNLVKLSVLHPDSKALVALVQVNIGVVKVSVWGQPQVASGTKAVLPTVRNCSDFWLDPILQRPKRDRLASRMEFDQLAFVKPNSTAEWASVQGDIEEPSGPQRLTTIGAESRHESILTRTA